MALSLEFIEWSKTGTAKELLGTEIYDWSIYGGSYPALPLHDQLRFIISRMAGGNGTLNAGYGLHNINTDIIPGIKEMESVH